MHNINICTCMNMRTYIYVIHCSFEKAGTHVTEVPRILLDDTAELEDYVLNSQDK